MASPLLRRFCGDIRPGTITGLSNYRWVKLKVHKSFKDDDNDRNVKIVTSFEREETRVYNPG